MKKPGLGGAFCVLALPTGGRPDDDLEPLLHHLHVDAA